VVATSTYQDMNNPMEKYVGCRSVIDSYETMTYRVRICLVMKSRDTYLVHLGVSV
jgi:hypothetical protein